jgi:hypothetical protein
VKLDVKGRLKKIISILAALVLLAVPNSVAHAADGEAPQLSNFSVTPATVDLRAGASQFTLQGRVTDVSGVYFITFFCVVPGQENRFRGLQVGLLFTAGSPQGFASLTIGGGITDSDRIKSQSVLGDSTDFTFAISAELPAAANSTHCDWQYNTSDTLGNRFLLETGSVGERFRVIDSDGFQFENPAFAIPTSGPGAPSITYSWSGNTLTFVVSGLPPTTQKFVARFWVAGQVHYATALETNGEFRHSKYLSEQTPIRFSISFEVAGFTYNLEPVGVEGKVRETSVKLVADQKTLASFSSTSTTLTNLQRSQVKAAVEANPNATKFICTGIRYVSQPMSENIKVRKRAKAACDYAKTLNPELSTWYQNKPTEARSYAGKVLLTIKSPAN